MNLQTFNYNNQAVTFDTHGEVMINATQMARPFGKKTKDFLKLAQTKAFVNVLSKGIIIPSTDKQQVKGAEITTLNRKVQSAVKVTKGGPYQGTWMHRKLALKFAAWLSPEFELWVYDRIEELMLQGQQQRSASQANADILSAIERLQSDVNQLKASTAPAPQQIANPLPKPEPRERTWSFSAIASELGLKYDSLYQLLSVLDVIRYEHGGWVMTEKYRGMNYAVSRRSIALPSATKSLQGFGNSEPVYTIYWTETGREFLLWALNPILTRLSFGSKAA